MVMNRTVVRWFGGMRFVVFLFGAASPAALAAEFPFEREMLMDVKPLPGSKRVPMLEILADGRAIIDLWCKSSNGRAEVTGDTIKFTLGGMREEGCTPERLQRDEELAAALEQVTQWRIEDDILLLVGPTELRYRHSSH
jgi:hypothetical protein